ncbi:methyl-accepting chemotaxis protein [Paenibacillus terrigena]|uniref:methyl-accepting chemotaxis protein n=1 Tax=Paenibacillus terrigena TaxID=369333 RepID=UPI0004760EC9|nr:methyl-accepting chemotaxis protein [Paenibacillus terrigena]
MRFSITRKIIISFLIVAVLLVSSGGFLLMNLSRMDKSYTTLLHRDTQILSNVERISTYTAQHTSSLQQFLLTNDEQNIQEMKQASQGEIQLIYGTLQLMEKDEDKQLMNQLVALSRDFNLKAENIINEAATDRQGAVKDATANLLPVGKQMERVTNQIAKKQEEVLKQSTAQNSSMVADLKLLSYGTIGLALLLAIIIGYMLSRLISRPLVKISRSAQNIANGDLTDPDIQVRNRDEIGDLAQSFNQMSRNLRHLLTEISEGAEHVAASSQELAAGAEQTNRSTEQIAVSITRVAEGTDHQVQNVAVCVQAMQELTVGAQQISDNAQQVADAVVVTREKSEEGNQSIQAAIAQMQSIEQTIDGLFQIIVELGDRSKHINKMVEFITSIAKQTNLLALNAAIESARAGEHGKGFAVVAQEIRLLAEQSSQSAMQITELISKIQSDSASTVQSCQVGREEIQEGIRIVNLAGGAFGHIQTAILRVSDEIQLASSSIEQMNVNTAQVVKSMDAISEMTERSASESQTVTGAVEEQLASMEEFASFVDSLSKRAEQLQAQTSKFTI